MTTNTDTPRTDAIISAIDMDSAFQDLCRQLEIELAHSLANQAKAQVEISAYKELAIALCNELISRCNDPIHKNQLEELTK